MSASPAPAILTLRAQIDEAWPARSRASDGIMGDAAHAARQSDHNEGNALDVTTDLAHGPDLHALAEALFLDPRTHYVIIDRQIKTHGVQHDAWHAYTGPDPHTGHLHLSIYAAQREDTSPWNLTPPSAPPSSGDLLAGAPAPSSAVASAQVGRAGMVAASTWPVLLVGVGLLFGAMALANANATPSLALNALIKPTRRADLTSVRNVPPAVHKKKHGGVTKHPGSNEYYFRLSPGGLFHGRYQDRDVLVEVGSNSAKAFIINSNGESLGSFGRPDPAGALLRYGYVPYDQHGNRMLSLSEQAKAEEPRCHVCGRGQTKDRKTGLVDELRWREDELTPEGVYVHEHCEHPPDALNALTSPSEATFQRVLREGVRDAELGYLRDGMRPMKHFHEAFAGAAARGVSSTALATSGEYFKRGQTLPIRITVSGTNRVYLDDGRHRYTAARAAGAKQILADVVLYKKSGDVAKQITTPVNLL